MSDDTSQIEVLIIGGGPAGMSAAMWCADLGLRSLVVEAADRFGGQLGWIHNPVKNYLGGEFASGEVVRETFERSLTGFRYERLFSMEVASVDGAGPAVLLDGNRLEAKAVVIATGVRRRVLGVPGEAEFFGKGILDSGSKRKGEATGRVAVVGGGDAALENALILSGSAEKVFLIHRRESFSARSEFEERIAKDPKIEVIYNVEVESFNGGDQLSSVRIRGSEEIREIVVDHAVVRIGVEPNSEIAPSGVERDPRGYLLIDAQCKTSVDRVWAIGDVVNPVSPTIATAVGNGATCAKSIAKFIRENE